MTHPATRDVWGHVVSDSAFDGDFILRFSFKLVKDAQFPAKGHFAIQSHKIVDTEIQVRDLLRSQPPTVTLVAKPRTYRKPATGQWLHTLDGRLGASHPRPVQPLFGQLEKGG